MRSKNTNVTIDTDNSIGIEGRGNITIENNAIIIENEEADEVIWLPIDKIKIIKFSEPKENDK